MGPIYLETLSEYHVRFHRAEREGHRDGAGAEAGDGIDSTTFGDDAGVRVAAAPPPVNFRVKDAQEFVLMGKRRFPLGVYRQLLRLLHDYYDQQITTSDGGSS